MAYVDNANNSRDPIVSDRRHPVPPQQNGHGPRQRRRHPRLPHQGRQHGHAPSGNSFVIMKYEIMKYSFVIKYF